MTNTALLKGKVMASGLTFEELSTMLGITASTLSLKVNNKSEFTAGEIAHIVNALKLSSEESMAIFFAKNCD